MTVACRHPDRIDGCISIDAAPVNESGNEAFGSFAKQVLDFMISFNHDTTRQEAIFKTKEYFKGKAQFVALVDRSLEYLGPDSDQKQAKFIVNIPTLLKKFDNIPAFDEDLRYEGQTLFVMGSRSRIYEFDQFKKVFPNLK